MRIPDELLATYYRLVMESDDRPPRPARGEARARPLHRHARARGRRPRAAAEEHFTRVVREGQAPDEVVEVELPRADPVHLPRLLVDSLGIGSASEARRLIGQGAVRLDGEVVTELDVPREQLEGRLLQAGKRRFARLTP